MNTYRYTDKEYKADTTSTYCNLSQLPPSGYVSSNVQGKREYLNTGINIWYDENANGKDVVLSIGEWFIKQNVREHGSSYARLRFALESGYPGTVKGVWSPDSVGTGRYAN